MIFAELNWKWQRHLGGLMNVIRRPIDEDNDIGLQNGSLNLLQYIKKRKHQQFVMSAFFTKLFILIAKVCNVGDVNLNFYQIF